MSEGIDQIEKKKKDEKNNRMGKQTTHKITHKHTNEKQTKRNIPGSE